MKNIITISVLFANLLTISLSAQNKDLADKKYERFAYADAIRIYERIAAKGYKSADVFRKLGDAYYFNAQQEQAAKWYGEMFAAKQKEIKPEYYYRYAQSLKAIGQYEKANQMLAEFTKRSATDSRAKLIAAEKDYLSEIKQNSGRYTIADAGVNSEFSDYGSSLLNSKLIFASARDTGSVFNRKYKWTDQSFTSLYSAEIAAQTKPEVKKFAREINSRFHESTPVFTHDGNTMYFTRNNFNDGKKGQNSKKTTLLKIYRATYINGKWTNVTELPFNSNNYSVAHPALSADEKYLYFASDMPGTVGQSDLWRVTIGGDGKFGKPENLGKTINTEGRETFPALTDENELYFATDGRPGLGGLDIYRTVILADGFSDPENIGEPANSPYDDFGYIIDTKTRTGYLTSNRPGGKGFDDIYKFSEIKKLNCEQQLEGIVTDFETGKILSGTSLSLSDQNMTVIAQTTSNSHGRYAFDVGCDKKYTVRAEKTLYETAETTISIPNSTGKTDLPISLKTMMQEISVGTDLAKILDIQMIYFDLDKWDIRPDAALELEKIVEILHQYPKMKIDVRSHTDSRQTKKYNAELSGKRAAATVQWLIANGIESSRLTGKGYGETQLLNRCSDGVDCSEEEHQVNRRSEFIVTSLQ